MLHANRRLLLLAAPALAAGLAAAPASALTVTTVDSAAGLNLSISDDAYDGTTDASSMAAHTLNVGPLAETTIIDVNVSLKLNHPFAGDLIAKLQSPGGTLFTLFHRPGLTFSGDPINDDGSGVGGDSANFVVDFKLTFDDQAPSGILAEFMGNGLLGSESIGDPAANSPDNYLPDPDDGTTDGLSIFNGGNAVGGWTLFLGDAAPGQEGSLDSWSLTVTTDSQRDPGGPTATPEPTVAILAGLALAGLGAATRRRR